MNYEMVVVDLDDTLLTDEHKITAKTLEVINKLKNKNVKITVATGRMYKSALPYIKKLGVKLPVISYNGAYVCNPLTHEVIYHKSIEKDLVNKIVLEAEKEDLHVNVYKEDNFYIEERNEGVEIYEKVAGIRGKAIGKLSENYNDESTKLLLVEPELAKKRHFINYFKDKYGEELEITESKNSFIELMAKGVSKGVALKNLANSLNINQEHIIAIGNGYNDLEMLNWAGLGIAVENAYKGVKKDADLIADTNNNEGVAKILEDIFEL